MWNYVKLFVNTLLFIILLTGKNIPLLYENFKTLRVPTDYPLIQEAINAAKPGDTVFVEPSTYEESITINKSISLVGDNSATTVIDGKGTGHVIVVSSDNVVIKGFTVRNSGLPLYAGIYLHQAKNVSLIDNIITNCSIGVKSYSSSDIQAKNNQITNNSDFGVYIKHFSTRNLIYENKIAYNYYGIGLLTYSSNSSLCRNSIVNNKCGIYISYSKNNHIELNNITHNSLCGINLEGLEGSLTVNNAIIKNNLTENRYGIYISLVIKNNETSNTIYQNNFVNNTLFQAFVEPPFFSKNIWNLPYPLGGNYWSDYQFRDMFQGVYQNISGSDGLGDRPYLIAQNNVDQYPLINPFVEQNELEPQASISYYQFVTAFVLITFVGAIMYLILKKQASYTKRKLSDLYKATTF
jgi:parallel beta-helix repeat protein